MRCTPLSSFNFPCRANGARAASGPEVSGSERIAPAQSTASPGQQAASAADVGIVEADDGAGPLWHAGTAHDAASARDTDHATGHTQNHELGSALTSAEPEADHRMHAFNSADPLAGLYSSRLRDALEREAFGSASSIAQDSAIVARADSFAHRFEERSKSFGPYSVSIDISRTAQNARIAALNGEIPLFARGDPELDPAITRALGRSTSREPTTTPTRSPTEVSAQLLTASPPRVRDSGMER